MNKCKATHYKKKTMNTRKNITEAMYQKKTMKVSDSLYAIAMKQYVWLGAIKLQ